MFKSVKSQIILGMSMVIVGTMLASAYFIIDQKIRESNADINDAAMGFAELTHERIISNYENNYTQKAYANFNREMADIYRLNPDISGITVYDYKGTVLYNSSSKAFNEITLYIPEVVLNLPPEEISKRINEFNEQNLIADSNSNDGFKNMPDKQRLMANSDDNPAEENNNKKLTANLGESVNGNQIPNKNISEEGDIKKLPEQHDANPEIEALKKLNVKNLGAAYNVAEKLSSADSERIQAVYMSVKTKKGSIVYLDKSEELVRYTDFNGRTIKQIGNSEQIEDIIYPFRDSNNTLRSYSIKYKVIYNTLKERVGRTRNSMTVLAVFGITIALFIGEIIARKITSPIKILTEGVMKIGSGDLSTQIAVKSESEIGKLASTFNKMAQDLQKNTKELVAKEKMTHELKLAGEIQKELLPKNPPKIANLDIAASLVSAEEVGGDCYDFLRTDDDNLIFYIGDVTGHGVPAGLVAAINNALVPAFLKHYKTTHELIVPLNELLKAKTRPNVFMTMIMAHWHIQKARLGLTQAGHNPALYYNNGKKNIAEMSSGGMALGMIDNISNIVKTEYIDMNINDVAVLYTDGITEAWKNDRENYGIDRLKESVLKHCALKTAQKIHDGIIKDVRDFMGNYPQADDITLIVVKRTV